MSDDSKMLNTAVEAGENSVEYYTALIENDPTFRDIIVSIPNTITKCINCDSGQKVLQFYEDNGESLIQRCPSVNEIIQDKDTLFMLLAICTVMELDDIPKCFRGLVEQKGSVDTVLKLHTTFLVGNNLESRSFIDFRDLNTDFEFTIWSALISLSSIDEDCKGPHPSISRNLFAHAHSEGMKRRIIWKEQIGIKLYEDGKPTCDLSLQDIIRVKKNYFQAIYNIISSAA